MKEWWGGRAATMAVYDYFAGTDTRAYEWLGVHRRAQGDYVVRFSAPGARSVSLCGAFLTDGQLAMSELDRRGVWETVIKPEIPLAGMAYHFLVDGTHRCADPYARCASWESEHCSVITEASRYLWEDDAWMRTRSRGTDRPLNLYRVHLSSFATRQGRSCVGGDAYLRYREFGELLVPYVSDMGFTHIRLMPLTEHGDDGRYGYRSYGYFVPTSRHGTADDFRDMIDRLHRQGLGVVMDLALGGDTSEGRYSDLTRPDVQSFFLSAVLFWLRAFHLDGLCLCSGACPAEVWEAFWENLVAAVRSEFPEVWLFCDREGGDVDLVAHSRFRADVRQLFATEPARRCYLTDRLALTLRDVTCREHTSLLSLEREGTDRAQFSLFGGMWGRYLQKFEGMRLSLAYQMAHPGKKQLFMGTELGQPRPWDGSVPPDWFLRELEIHAALRRYVRALNRFYLGESRLWQEERSADLCYEPGGSLLTVIRTDHAGRKLYACFNFTDAPVQCPIREETRILFYTDASEYGGQGRLRLDIWDNRNAAASRLLPAMSAVFLEPIEQKDMPYAAFVLPPIK